MIVHGETVRGVLPTLVPQARRCRYAHARPADDVDDTSKRLSLDTSVMKKRTSQTCVPGRLTTTGRDSRARPSTLVTTAGDSTTWTLVPRRLPASPASQVRAKGGLLPDKSYLYLRRSVTVGWSRWVQCSMHEPYLANARAFQYTQHGRLPGCDGWHVDASSSPRDATKTHQERCQRSCTGQKEVAQASNMPAMHA